MEIQGIESGFQCPCCLSWLAERYMRNGYNEYFCDICGHRWKEYP